MASARTRILTGVLWAAAGIAGGPARAGTPAPALVPMPREVRALPGGAALGPDWVVAADSAGEDGPAVRDLLREAAQGPGWTWRTSGARVRPRTIALRALPAPERPTRLTAQAYRLTIAPRRIEIAAASATGRFYGVQTLRQLLRAHPDGRLPCLEIEDQPALEWRGVSDDISRGQISTLADFEATLHELAYYKLNLYQLYIEDAYRFASDPAGGAPGALTRAELAELVAEGRRCHVVVSPIFETLSHQEHLLAEVSGGGSEPGPRPNRTTASAGAWAARLANLGAWVKEWLAPDGGEPAAPAAFSPGDPEVLRFVGRRVDELAAVTRGPFFHLGGDEWQPSTDAEDAGAYGRALAALARRVTAHAGCRAMVYGDVILSRPDAVRELPRDVVVVDWQYEPADTFPSLARLRARGFRDLVVSPAIWSWDTFYPNYALSLADIATFADAGRRARALGCITASWGDGGAENLRANNALGFAYAAAASWQEASPAVDAFLPRFVLATYGIASAELADAERLLGWQQFGRLPWAGRLYHRPLVVRARSARSNDRMRALAADMQRAQADLAAASPLVRSGRDRLAVLAHAARRYRFLADRELALDAIGRRLEGRASAALPAAEQGAIVASLSRLEAESRAIGAEYSALWLAHDRPEGLAGNVARLERQSQMLGRLCALAQRGRLTADRSLADLQADAALP